uniref:Uncharacterized protein n=1 Tax=Panagrolaimus davidi TaxID=227884 RepID=A0A914QRM0_9BILA
MESSNLKERVVDYLNGAIYPANSHITSNFEHLCSDGLGREKRFIPIPFGIIVIVGLGLMFAGGIEYARNQVENAKMMRLIEEEKNYERIKTDLNEYINTNEIRITKFMKKLYSGRLLTVNEIPAILKGYFDLPKSGNSYFFIRLIRCNTNSISIQITATSATISQSYKCHRFMDFGHFNEDFYQQYQFPKPLCYHNKTCLELNPKKMKNKITFLLVNIFLKNV